MQRWTSVDLTYELSLLAGWFWPFGLYVIKTETKEDWVLGTTGSTDSKTKVSPPPGLSSVFHKPCHLLLLYGEEQNEIYMCFNTPNPHWKAFKWEESGGCFVFSYYISLICSDSRVVTALGWVRFQRRWLGWWVGRCFQVGIGNVLYLASDGGFKGVSSC